LELADSAGSDARVWGRRRTRAAAPPSSAHVRHHGPPRGDSGSRFGGVNQCLVRPKADMARRFM